MKQIVILLALLGSYFFSCEEEEYFDVLTFAQCENMLTDSLAIRSNLVGTWTWTERYCPCCQDSKPEKADKKVTATFNANGTTSIEENGTVIGEGEWTLQKTYIGFSLVVNNQPAVPYLRGYLSICKAFLLADESPVDGCKHLFKKIE